MLRVAEPKDIDHVVTMAMKFANASPYAKYVTEEKVRSIVTDIINGSKQEKVIFLYEDVGMLAAVTSPFLFGTLTIATEVAWWIEPDYRGLLAGKKLLDVYEIWAKDVGCNLISMACLDKKVGKYLDKRGYKIYESAYLKEV